MLFDAEALLNKNQITRNVFDGVHGENDWYKDLLSNVLEALNKAHEQGHKGGKVEGVQEGLEKAADIAVAYAADCRRRAGDHALVKDKKYTPAVYYKGQAGAVDVVEVEIRNLAAEQSAEDKEDKHG